MIIPTAEPFFFPGSRIGCLLVHGFTGTPKEMRWMGEYLSARGHTVLGVRLAGHATQPADLVRTRWWDWQTSVEDGLHQLAGFTDQVFIAGLSMGGSLALLTASRYPVKGVIAMSTPYTLPPDPRLPYLRWLSFLKPRIEKGPPDWHNPLAAIDHIHYPSYPTRATAELRDLLAEMRKALPLIKVPVLLVHSRKDTGVDPSQMPAIFEALSTLDKQMLWLEDSGHVITREPERERLFLAAHEFIMRISKLEP